MKKLNVKLNIYDMESIFEYWCNEDATVLDLFKYISDIVLPKMNIEIEIKNNIMEMVSYDSCNSFGFITPKQEMRLLFKNVSLLNLLEYLEIDINNVEIAIVGGMGAAYDIIDGIKFFTHSNEENHKNVPHIHTEYENKEASYSIITREKLAGTSYPAKVEKLIKSIILKHCDELKTFWLDTTNGVWPMHYPFIIEIK